MDWTGITVITDKHGRPIGRFFIEKHIKHDNITSTSDERNMADYHSIVGGKSGLHGTTHWLIYQAGRPDDQSNSDETIKFE